MPAPEIRGHDRPCQTVGKIAVRREAGRPSPIAKYGVGDDQGDRDSSPVRPRSTASSGEPVCEEVRRVLPRLLIAIDLVALISSSLTLSAPAAPTSGARPRFVANDLVEVHQLQERANVLTVRITPRGKSPRRMPTSSWIRGARSAPRLWRRRATRAGRAERS
jgi:hypothetical protein